MKVDMDQIMWGRYRLGTVLKYSGFFFYLGHREPLRVLNEAYALYVKEGFVPHPSN